MEVGPLHFPQDTGQEPNIDPAGCVSSGKQDTFINTIFIIQRIPFFATIKYDPGEAIKTEFP
jgi:hypothetical protein